MINLTLKDLKFSFKKIKLTKKLENKMILENEMIKKIDIITKKLKQLNYKKNCIFINDLYNVLTK